MFIKSTIQYGPETIALVFVLNTIEAVSIDRIHDILHVACNRNYAYIKEAFITAGEDRFSPYCCRYRIDKPFDDLPPV